MYYPNNVAENDAKKVQGKPHAKITDSPSPYTQFRVFDNPSFILGPRSLKHVE
jgi:hypothetical protein